MQDTYSLKIKVIISQKEKIIGWKGDVLEIGLKENNNDSLLSFFSSFLGVSPALFSLFQEEKNIYIIEIKTKYREDPTILFT